MVDVFGFEGLYSVTSCGKIWSHRSQRFLKPSDNGKGYLHVVLVDACGQKHDCYVHRLVCEAYVPNVDGKPEVSHLDECNAHNWARNLTWATTKENSNMPLHKERQAEVRGRACRCVETDVVYCSSREAERKTGVKSSNIRNVCNGKKGYNTAGGFHWQWAS